MDYEIVLSALEGKSSEFESLLSSVNGFLEESKSSLSSMSGTEISGLYNNVNESMERLKNGYSNCNTWLSDYTSELNSLEMSLAGFSCPNIDAPTEFNGEFIDMFGKKVIPTLKTGGDKDSNLDLGKTGESFSEKGQKITSSAMNVGSPGGGLCAAWVSMVYEAAGYGYPGGNANDMFYNWCTSDDRNDLEPGMIVAVPSHPHTSAGQTYGHVAIYMGNGMVRDNIGYIRDISLDEWLDYYGATYTPKWGWITS